MKDSIDRIQRDGYSEELRRWVEKWRIEKSRADLLNSGKGYTYYTLLHFNDSSPYYDGIVEKSASVIVELGLNRVVEVNVDSRELLQVNGEEVKGVEHNHVLDLSDEGERWEGDVFQNKPYGWGVLYDNEGEKKYEGFMIGEVNACYGRSYFSDIQKVEYEGEWCEGKRWGTGIHYDRNGKVMFDGEWMDDKKGIERRLKVKSDALSLHNLVTELIVSNNSCNGPEWSVLDLPFMSDLRLLQVGDNCFERVNEVKLTGLNELERVVIGKNSFRKQSDNRSRQDPNRAFYLKNCERLRELKMGSDSFSDYFVCEIENVPSLEVIEMGILNKESSNFLYASLELKSDCSVLRMMIRLARIDITSVW